MIKDRLLRFIAMENISSTQFADAIGVQRSTVSHLLSGRNNPSYDFIVKILNHYKYLSADWLICGIGPMYRQKDGSTNDIFSQAVASADPVETKEKTVNQLVQPSTEPLSQQEPAQNPAVDTLNNNYSLDNSNDSESTSNNQQNIAEALPKTAQQLPNVQPSANNAGKTIQRIVIFYTDRSMDIYEQ
ncbi:MAG: helix-turn-helix transcriptional regulator [Bacteroidales bacterium]|nr:helix-turn-helix transcriptional regulator [Bacteroidales bacterium]